MITRSSITIDNVRLYAFHGVMEQERTVGGWFTVSLRVDCDFGRAAQTDCVDDTINYAELLKVVKREMGIPSKLLEHVAGRIAQVVVGEFPQVNSVWVRVVKLNPPMGANCDGAGVEIEMTNQ
jgi:dihydroneopterin aldolase